MLSTRKVIVQIRLMTRRLNLLSHDLKQGLKYLERVTKINQIKEKYQWDKGYYQLERWADVFMKCQNNWDSSWRTLTKFVWQLERHNGQDKESKRLGFLCFNEIAQELQNIVNKWSLDEVLHDKMLN